MALWAQCVSVTCIRFDLTLMAWFLCLLFHSSFSLILVSSVRLYRFVCRRHFAPFSLSCEYIPTLIDANNRLLQVCWFVASYIFFHSFLLTFSLQFYCQIRWGFIIPSVQLHFSIYRLKYILFLPWEFLSLYLILSPFWASNQLLFPTSFASLKVDWQSFSEILFVTLC